MVEQQRINFLLRRDGKEACIAWVTRTMVIYRRAVLNPRHFASSKEYRRSYIAAYCLFKRWLAQQTSRTGSKGSCDEAVDPIARSLVG